MPGPRSTRPSDRPRRTLLPSVWLHIAPEFKLAGIALAAYLSVWIFLVNTRLGQQLDDRALIARGILPHDVVRAINNFLAFSTPFFAAAFCFILLALGWRTRRVRLGFAMAISLGITEIVGETLKYFEEREILDPALYEDLGDKTFNSFPSGTTALAVGFVLGLIAVVTYRSRIVTFRLGLVFIQFVAMFVVLAGWHRPSDALGGIALAVFFACIGLYLGHGSRADGASGPHLFTVNVPWKSALALGAAVLAFTAILGSFDSLPEEVNLVSLTIFMLLIPLFAAWLVTKFTRLAGLGLPSVNPNA